jgi:hypothetical protein
MNVGFRLTCGISNTRGVGGLVSKRHGRSGGCYPASASGRRDQSVPNLLATIWPCGDGWTVPGTAPAAA